MPQPQPTPKSQGHPSSAENHTPKAPLAGTWPELAPRPPIEASHNSEHLEHALARAERLSLERSAV
ncbi:hypothetical protein [Arthrobacter sp. R-11]|uniref:hypothetical protein n=1 Tax=Arthrobacter sp. R-11 TaxID=3404053 RepID=UPI003CF8553F